MTKRDLVYGFSILLLPISAFLTPTEWIMGRNAMFLALIMLVLQFLFSRQRLNQLSRQWLLVAVAIGGIALSQLWWVMQYGDKHVSELLANTNYAVTYKFLIAFSGLILVVSVIPREVIHRFRFPLLLMICLAFGIGAIEAFYTYFTESSSRANIGGISTTAAYLATIQGLLCIYAINKIATQYRRVLMVLIAIITLTIIVMTGTRSAIILFPVILMLMAVKTMNFRDVIKLFPVFIIMLAIPLVASHQVRDRFAEAYQDICQDGSNNSTSIGSRFSMWISGLSTAHDHPFGQSAESRLKDITRYINANERGNTEALRNVPYHLHNEVIEIASLQGLIPAVFMLTFYIFTVLAFRKQGKIDLAAFTFTMPLVVFGIGDVLMIYPKAIFCVFSTLSLYCMLSRLRRP